MRHLLLIFALLFVACNNDDRDFYVNNPTAPSDPVVRSNVFEYRVSGNAQQVRVRYSNPVDGTSQVTTALPFFTSFRSDRDYLFLAVDVTPVTYPFNVFQPFVTAQILVNGELFTQSSSAEFLETVSTSGTWRR